MKDEDWRDVGSAATAGTWSFTHTYHNKAFCI